MPISPIYFERPPDGYNSHEDNPDWGATGTRLLRLPDHDWAPAGAMSGDDRPGPREISNAVVAQYGDTENAAGASDFLWIWGQFLDHDLSLTSAGMTNHADIPVPQWDPHFDPHGSGGAHIHFTRVDPHDGYYTNEITAYIDASMIYGSDAARLAELRVDGGKMLLTEDGHMVRDGQDFLTGDVRAAENVALSSMHTIFTREHNRVVDKLAKDDPALSADELFHMARARVEATIQAITYNEFLPILIGKDSMAEYEGYDPLVNPGISVEFSTAVFRLGHTLLSANLQRMGEDGTEYQPLALRDAFFQPDLMTEPDMIEDIMRGAATQKSQALDNMLVDDVRNFLFGPPGAGGFDLAALNIQRGRDLGISSYNDMREDMGFDRVTSFSDITSDAQVAAKLASVYDSVDDVDAWVGGLAEDAHGDGLLGETFTSVMVDQFHRLRSGDYLYSLGRADLSPAEKEKLWDTTLSDVILRNTDVDALQKDAFAAMYRMAGTNRRDKIAGGEERDFIFGKDGHDHLWGGGAGDDLQGGGGHDKLWGEDGGDYLDGGKGNDKLWGGGEDDFLWGGNGRDGLWGDDGDDGIDGGHGHDTIVGGAGDDTLKGGAGRDCFEFYSRDEGHDVIEDFEVRKDYLKLVGLSRRQLEASEVEGELTLTCAATDWTLTIENLTLEDWSQHGWTMFG